jgi:hypothetical protein
MINAQMRSTSPNRHDLATICGHFEMKLITGVAPHKRLTRDSVAPHWTDTSTTWGNRGLAHSVTLRLKTCCSWPFRPLEGHEAAKIHRVSEHIARPRRTRNAQINAHGNK